MLRVDHTSDLLSLGRSLVFLFISTPTFSASCAIHFQNCCGTGRKSAFVSLPRCSFLTIVSWLLGLYQRSLVPGSALTCSSLSDAGKLWQQEELKAGIRTDLETNKKHQGSADRCQESSEQVRQEANDIEDNFLKVLYLISLVSLIPCTTTSDSAFLVPHYQVYGGRADLPCLVPMDTHICDSSHRGSRDFVAGVKVHTRFSCAAVNALAGAALLCRNIYKTP